MTEHRCPYCGRFVDTGEGFYNFAPGSDDGDFVRVYCSEDHNDKDVARYRARVGEETSQ